HGQRVAHVAAGDPANPLSRAATLQLAEAAVIAERTGRPVIADFRAADMAAGGVGAPFVPYADLLLLGGPTGRIALNLGGISNLTVLPAGTRREDVYAFDCGPANMIIDGLARHFFGEPFDRDGAHAARGRVHREMLASLMNHPFIAAAPPKAAGHEQFGRPFLHDLLARWGAVPPEDLLATATAFAAHAVALNLSRHVLPRHPVEELIASGGGVHNPTLRRALTAAGARACPRAARGGHRPRLSGRRAGRPPPRGEGHPMGGRGPVVDPDPAARRAGDHLRPGVPHQSRRHRPADPPGRRGRPADARR